LINFCLIPTLLQRRRAKKSQPFSKGEGLKNPTLLQRRRAKKSNPSSKEKG
jgi:hypothetical protein